MKQRRIGRDGRFTPLLAAAILLSPTMAKADSGRTVEVVASEFAFKPSRIEVQAGETVHIRLIDRGSLSHNLSLRGIDAKTRTIQSGASDTLTFTPTESGSIEFFCSVPGHAQAGMTGKIVVE